MSISDTQYMSDNASDGYTPDVVQTHREPSHGLAVFLGEIVPHDRLEFGHELGITFGQFAGIVIFDL